ncbi:MAG: hypothetical protein ACTSRU_10975 [Candidatus Hodarchaeales archaeon]
MSQSLFDNLLKKRDKSRKRKKERKAKNVPLKILRREKHSGLSLLSLTPQESKKHFKRKGDYKHLIRSSGATSHSAFRTKKGLREFLDVTGLKISKKPSGRKGNKLSGSYQRISYQGTQKKLDDKAKKEKWKPTKVLSNGQFIRGYIQKSSRGNRIHYMNPNYNPRKLKYVWK